MDINISSNTLFHFTNDIKNLKNILDRGLYVRYSLENFDQTIGGKSEILIPMTCFCDIPLSQVKRHTETYGKFAIGLSKEWGVNNKISPVIYTYPKSNTAEILNNINKDIGNYIDIENDADIPSDSFLDTLSEFINSIDEKTKPKKEDENAEISQNFIKISSRLFHLHNSMNYLIQNIKPYQGKIYRNGEYSNNVKFYDEREWRFLLPRNFFEEHDLKAHYNKKFYTNPVKRRYINIQIAKHFKLEFHPKDIKFIIIDNEKKIPDMLKYLEEIFGDREGVTQNDIKLLGTRLISIQHIIENF